ncbi:DNA methyltransferase [Psychrobacillus sp. PGGUH221]|uniref:DNA modification methylase n=1 Tax=Psychrobacillus sp. PGGUH221 TaxID=3020058 RepID=UPI0035C6B7C2
MQIEMQHVDELIPYAKNARHNDKAVDKVASSIQEFGFKNPIIVDEHNEIIAGHTRLLAAKKLGITEVPTIKVDDLTPEQIKAFRIADNKTAEIAEWDYELLAQELEELKLADYNLELTGFDFSEAEELLDSLKDENDHAEADDFEVELPENPISQKGDIWLLGKHRLVCGDSTKVEDVTVLMDGEKASMVFTDPPWNVNYGAIKEGNPQGYKPRTIKNDFMPTEDFKEFMNQAFQVMNQFSKEGCMTYVVMSAQEWGNLMLTLTENGYHWSSTIIWNKDSIVLSRKDYHTKYEPIWYGWKEGRARLHPLKDRKQGDVWDIPRPKVSELHPTMKPIQLIVQAIKNSSNMNDIVLDLFGGSGSTLIACQETDRVCRTMELDEKYADVIVNRYIDYMGDNGDVYLIREGEKIAYSDLTTLQ